MLSFDSDVEDVAFFYEEFQYLLCLLLPICSMGSTGERAEYKASSAHSEKNGLCFGEIWGPQPVP